MGNAYLRGIGIPANGALLNKNNICYKELKQIFLVNETDISDPMYEMSYWTMDSKHNTYSRLNYNVANIRHSRTMCGVDELSIDGLTLVNDCLLFAGKIDLDIFRDVYVTSKVVTTDEMIENTFHPFGYYCRDLCDNIQNSRNILQKSLPINTTIGDFYGDDSTNDRLIMSAHSKDKTKSLENIIGIYGTVISI